MKLFLSNITYSAYGVLGHLEKYLLHFPRKNHQGNFQASC